MAPLLAIASHAERDIAVSTDPFVFQLHDLQSTEAFSIFQQSEHGENLRKFGNTSAICSLFSLQVVMQMVMLGSSAH